MPLITDLGAGERDVLALARESRDAIAILDDGAARRVAAVLEVRHRGTLGMLLEAKRKAVRGRPTPSGPPPGASAATGGTSGLTPASLSGPIWDAQSLTVSTAEESGRRRVP